MKLQKYTLRNSNGMNIEFLNLGGIVTKIRVPERDGYCNLVLALENENDYLISNPAYYGAIIGRYANRIARASFELNDQSYFLYKNDGENALHGGKKGFDKVFWDVKEIEKEMAYELSYLSPDGEEGYPGNLQVTITYSLALENAFTIRYRARTDKTTHLNLTHHSYFNLSGQAESTILDHELKINSRSYTVSDESYLPTGDVRQVEKENDFRSFKTVGRDMHLLKAGYNHNYILPNEEQPYLAATLRHPASKREMDVLTTQPGLQFYSGHYLQIPSAGLALETQHYPDSVHHPQFPSTLLHPGEEYAHETSYRFRF